MACEAKKNVNGACECCDGAGCCCCGATCDGCGCCDAKRAAKPAK